MQAAPRDGSVLQLTNSAFWLVWTLSWPPPRLCADSSVVCSQISSIDGGSDLYADCGRAGGCRHRATLFGLELSIADGPWVLVFDRLLHGATSPSYLAMTYDLVGREDLRMPSR